MISKMKLFILLVLSLAALTTAKPAELDDKLEGPAGDEQRFAKRLLFSGLVNADRTPIFDWSATVGVTIREIRVTVTATNRPPTPSLLPFRGGVGSNNVWFDLSSRRGMTFRFEIWGR